MEKESERCTVCGEVGLQGWFHHSQAGELLCEACFRGDIKRKVLAEVKRLRRALSRPRTTVPTPRHTETLSEVQLQAKVSAKHIANDIRRAEITRRQAKVQSLHTDIADLTQQLQSLKLAIIDRQYKYHCRIPCEQYPNFLCKECLIRLEMGGSRRVTKSSIQNESINREALESCRCCCM